MYFNSIVPFLRAFVNKLLAKFVLSCQNKFLRFEGSALFAAYFKGTFSINAANSPAEALNAQIELRSGKV